MKAIGYANKFYTLWDVTCEDLYVTVNGQHRKSGEKIIRTYYQNLSTNLEKAKNRFTELTGIKAPELNEDLKGVSRSWTTTDNNFQVYFDYEFDFGKYRGMKIDECEDEEYLLWFYNETGGKRKDNVRNRLTSFGYKLYKGSMRTKKRIKAIKFQDSLVSGHHFENGEKVELNLTVGNMFSFSGRYGTTNVYEFYTHDKKIVKYMGSNGFGVEVGDKLTVKATIKHSEYQGVNETKLLRIKFI